MGRRQQGFPDTGSGGLSSRNRVAPRLSQRRNVIYFNDSGTVWKKKKKKTDGWDPSQLLPIHPLVNLFEVLI